ncbi:serine/threonine protein kinase [Mycobacterium sp. KBS0706]|uniref:serine/threonine-protein kinase n=1 Tax=Mycobacterium sp. KBS0706 TaxID=2578109 RepID=UPI00110FA3CC|nr:serine/threonine-protein kinase [Mycobacterium sp. KBS0706]TSD89885.1 serine/threonine protein kinase [Mycobacterium sp. KBS0706]
MTADPMRDAETPPADETRLVAPAAPSASAAPRASAAPGEPDAPAAPAEDGPSLAPGTVVLHTYRIIRLIGRGGMGEIYQAEHRDQRTLHAIKIIRPDLAGDESIVSLFLREAEALRKIRHAAIVAYDGLFRDSTGRLHLIMEYVDGPSLRDRLRQGPLAPHEIAQLRDRLAAGLAEAHDKGIYHRDLSPDNVILEHGRLEQAKLIDFGIARFADPSMRTLVGSRFAGKLSWASPEQIGLFGAQVDGRSDIYSLGLVLAAAARGRPLEMGKTMMATVEARKTTPDLDGVPPGLATQITRMLAPDPRDRPQSMRSLVDEAEPDRLRWLERLRSRPALGAALLLTLMAFAGAGWWWSGPDSPPAAPAPLPLMSAPPGAAEPAQELDREQLPRILTLAPAEVFAAGQRFLTEKRDADTALVLWEEASRRGSGDAAFGIAQFYDPNVRTTGPNPFSAPNPTRAREFYALALQRGIGIARARLQALDNAESAR